MTTEFFRKLQSNTRLSTGEIQAINELCGPAETVRPDTVLVAEGVRQHRGTLLVEGWAIRYRRLSDGRRQVIGFVLPGDLCDPTFFMARTANHSVATITRAVYRSIGDLELTDLLERQPRINLAFWWLAAHEKALLQEQLTTIGRGTAYERTAYTLWELWRRMVLAGHAADDAFTFPVTQVVLADSLGLSFVHTNRVLQQLRKQGLIRLQARSLSLLDPERLKEIGQSSDAHLLLDSPTDRDAIH